jgi:hypothetical protein
MWIFETRSFTQEGSVAIITTFMDNKESCLERGGGGVGVAKGEGILLYWGGKHI